MAKQKPFILVDGSSYLYRAFHAMPALTNSKGSPTGAVYGVINMLRKLLKEYQPDHMAVVFDAKGKTFRDELYDQYKAHRPPMPDELRAQIEPLHAIIRAMGLPLVILEGLEADDVIGTLAQEHSRTGGNTLISTGDKDMAQLVDDHITLINTMNDAISDHDAVVEKFGVRPDQIIDYLTLIGDKVDNVPGVPNVGPKTAAKWLSEYQTLDNIIANAEQIKGKVGENLRGALDQLPLSKQLVTLKCDADLPVHAAELILQPADKGQLKELFTELEFKSWLSEVLRDQESQIQNTPVVANSQGELLMEQAANYETILDEKQWQTWLKKLETASLIALDTETTSLDYMQARIVGLSFAVKTGEAAYLPVSHNYAGAPKQLDCDQVLRQLKPLLEDASKAKVGHNLKYDHHILTNHGIHLQGIAHDTMLESYLLDSAGSRHDLDTLALKHLGHSNITYEDVTGSGKKQITFDQVHLDQATPYAAEDADIALRLHQQLWPRLEKEPRLKDLYQAIEVPLIDVLATMEHNGVLIDAELLKAQSHQLEKRIQELEQQAHKEAGETFNLGSPKQIQALLFDKLQIPVLQKTPTGQPSTAEPVLQELAMEYELPRLILEYRSMSKLKSTYTDKLPQQIDPDTGRVHTSYHQAVAATGRLSSSDPNLQNIPVRSEEGRRIRQAFIAPPGYKLLAADYSQIELRIMAHLSNDAGLLRAFAAGIDIHRATAAEIFGCAPDQVDNDQRRSAKAINFGLIYGMSAFGLAKQLGIDRGAAQEYINLYFERYPGVKEYMDTTRRQAGERGYVETLFGRRLYLPDIRHRNMQRRQYAERTAINAPMQGTAADLIKLAMIKSDQWLRQQGDGVRMIMQVHDELVFEVAEGKLEQASEDIRHNMVSVAKLAVPLVVDIGIGDNWDQAH